MKNIKCIIVHGCPSSPEDPYYNKHWMPWAKKQIIAKGIPTENPTMPEPWNPNYEKFKTEFEKLSVDENTMLIGHSCGCAFLVRWLGETKKEIFKLILVAPWKLPTEKRNFKDKKFYNYAIDATIKDRAKEIIMFTSNNEAEDGKKSLKIFHDTLGGEIVELKNHGHYTMKDMGTKEFPELIDKI